MMQKEILLLLLVIFVSGCQTQGPVVNRATEVWEPTEQQLEQLQPRKEFEKYSLQLPPGFEKQPNQSNLNMPDLFLKSEDGTSISVEFGTTLYGYGKKPNEAEQLVTLVGQTLGDELKNFQQSPSEIGLIGTTEFARKTWSGTKLSSDVAYSGKLYCAVINGDSLRINIQYPGNQPPEDFELSEAAVFTFRAN